MTGPPKEKRGVATALQTAELRVAYHTIGFFAKLFGETFWFFEQRRCRLVDRLENEGSDQ
jgi:hypothetical protein